MGNSIETNGGDPTPENRKKLTPLSSYQKRLFFFLSVATFFEGYDFMAITQILPNFRAEMGVSETGGTYLIALINAGTVLAYILIRQADRFGRKRILSLTIVGYAIASFLSGLAPNALVFGILQLIARIFLIGEWAISMVYAAEEFPADRRGMVIGVIQAFSSLGAIVCVGVVPFLLTLPYGWRNVYFVGAIPLVLIALARRNLRETSRFASQSKEQSQTKQSFLRIFRSPYRKRMLQLALIWALTYVCTHNGVTFWKEFALAERGMTDKEVGFLVTIAAIAAMPLVFFAGKLLDWIGRRKGATVIFLLTIVGVFGAYTLQSSFGLGCALVLAIFGASAVLPVLNAYNTELFPTHIRSDAFAWSNNLLGRIAYVLSPIGIGIAQPYVGWGTAISFTAIFPLIALILILVLLPETQGKELEETSAV